MWKYRNVFECMSVTYKQLGSASALQGYKYYNAKRGVRGPRLIFIFHFLGRTHMAIFPKMTAESLWCFVFLARRARR